jgi:hypothetical protein
MQRQEDSWIVKGKAIAKGKITKKVEKHWRNIAGRWGNSSRR